MIKVAMKVNIYNKETDEANHFTVIKQIHHTIWGYDKV